MRFRFLVVCALLAAGAVSARAQTPPSPLNSSGTAQPISQGTIWTPAQWSAAFASYMNWNGGHCQSCFLNGSTITGGSISGVSLAGAGDNLTVSGTTLSSIIAGLARDTANGVAGLDSTTHIPVALLPDLSNATVDGQSLALALGSAEAGTNFSGVPSLVCNTTGQNNSQSLATGNICITATAPTTGANSNYAPIVANIYSANNASQSSTISIVGEYIHAVSGPNSAQTWAQNPVLDIFPNSAQGGIIDEADLNNWACDPGNVDNPSSTCKVAAVGTLYEGASPYASQSAIDISGVSTTNAQWHEGIIALGGDIIDYATFYQNDGAEYGYVDKGSHAGYMIFLGGSSSNPALHIATSSPAAIDLTGSTNTQYAIGMPANGPNSIYWPASTGNTGTATETFNSATKTIAMAVSGTNVLTASPSGVTVAGTLTASGNITVPTAASTVYGTTSGGSAYVSGDAGGTLFVGNTATASNAGITTYNVNATGPVNIAGPMTASSASFSSNVVIGKSVSEIFTNSSGANDAYLSDNTNGNLYIGNAQIAGNAGLTTYNVNATGNLTVTGTTTANGNIGLGSGKSFAFNGTACYFFHDNTLNGLVYQCGTTRLARFPDNGSAPVFLAAPVVGSP